MGLVSLFSDMTYEGARSISGPFLGLLGGSAAAIGFVSGLGEFIGYGLRLLFGYFSDKTKNYWFFTIFGYALNLIAIPTLALVPENGWILACGLLLVERSGKAIRSPSKSTILSFASEKVGVGKGFGLHEAMDQTGAVLGPFILFASLAFKNTNSSELEALRFSFLALGLPAALAVSFLLWARFYNPHPDQSTKIEEKGSSETSSGPNRTFWIYAIGSGLFAAGFADFPLIAYHFQTNGLIRESWIPLSYSFAMFVDAIAAFYFGRLFDRIGIRSLAAAIFFSSFFAIFLFLKFDTYWILFGLILWGIGMGAQESVLNAAIAKMVKASIRGRSYGIFQSVFGLFWFLGSWVMGVFYEVSIPLLIGFSVLLQMSSVGIFWYLRERKAERV